MLGSRAFRIYISGDTAVSNRIQPPTSEGIHLVPNLGQPITQTAIRGRRGGARTDRRCGGVDPRKLRGRSRQHDSRRRCLQESLRSDHLRRGPPIQGGPVEAWEQASDQGNIQSQSEQPSRDTHSGTHRHCNTITHLFWVLSVIIYLIARWTIFRILSMFIFEIFSWCITNVTPLQRKKEKKMAHLWKRRKDYLAHLSRSTAVCATSNSCFA